MINNKQSPFQPGNPVKPEYFEGRHNLIKESTKYLVQTKSGIPQHFFINGRCGMGKSSFADYLLEYAKMKYAMIGIHVYNDGIHELNDLINNIVENLLIEVKKERWYKKIFSAFSDHIESVGVFGANVKFKPSEDSVVENIKDNFAYFLIDFLNNCDDKNGIFIVIDDINGLSQTSEFVNWYKRFAEILSSKFRDNAPIVMMLTSYPEKIVELHNHNPSFNRIFRHREIKALSRDEVKHFFVKMFNEIGVKLSEDALESMLYFSSGSPTMMQEIGDAIYWINEDDVINQKTALLGIIKAGQEIGFKYLKPALDSSIRSNKYLSIFNKLGQDFLSHAHEDYSFAKKDFINLLDSGEVKVFNDFLRRARQLGIIEFCGAKNSGRYKFTNNLYPIFFAIRNLEDSQNV